jgi:hypothetical protein
VAAVVEVAAAAATVAVEDMVDLAVVIEEEEDVEVAVVIEVGMVVTVSPLHSLFVKLLLMRPL